VRDVQQMICDAAQQEPDAVEISRTITGCSVLSVLVMHQTRNESVLG